MFVEKVVVDKDNNLANVVVYVRDKTVEVSPAYKDSEKDEVILDNKGCHFEPHVVVLRTTQKLKIKNSDPIAHNTKADLLKNPSFNDLIPADQNMEKANLTTEESLPMNVSCSIHPWMGGIIAIRTNPYTAVSQSDGSFEIRDLPVGKEIEFQFWQEKAGNLKNIAGKAVKVDSKGRAKIMIKPGDNDLGDIKVPADLLK